MKIVSVIIEPSIISKEPDAHTGHVAFKTVSGSIIRLTLNSHDTQQMLDALEPLVGKFIHESLSEKGTA